MKYNNKRLGELKKNEPQLEFFFRGWTVRSETLKQLINVLPPDFYSFKSQPNQCQKSLVVKQKL